MEYASYRSSVILSGVTGRSFDNIVDMSIATSLCPQLPLENCGRTRGVSCRYFLDNLRPFEWAAKLFKVCGGSLRTLRQSVRSVRD